MSERRQRVAIVGGGCAALTAAFELTQPHLKGRYEVTVFQQGWRLGGKGASGRGPHGRIEEHGLHVWMGFYENAFRLMRQTYGELNRDPNVCPVATCDHAFRPAPHIGLADWTPEQDWRIWSAVFPELPGRPGTAFDSSVSNPFTMAGYLLRATELLMTLFRVAYGPMDEPREPIWRRFADPAEMLAAVRDLLRSAVGTSMLGVALVERHVSSMLWIAKALSEGVGELLSEGVQLFGRVAEATQVIIGRLEPNGSGDFSYRRNALEAFELVLAALHGIVRSGAYHHPKGFDSLDDHDFATWLHSYGASRAAVTSPFARGLYSLMFAYEGGDYRQPSCAAGQCLRCFFRMFVTYRGAIFYKMQGGMGDIVFAPLYEVLRRRGVRFEFFHRLENIGTAGWPERPYIAELDFLVQAEVRSSSYEPLLSVKGVPCWPAAPDWSQLVDGHALNKEGRRFESFWDRRGVGRRVYRVNQDFDFAILGVGLGAVPHVARELIDNDRRWARMVDALKTVATVGLQLWMKPTLNGLGWDRGPVTLTSFTSPHDTWSDMTHLLDFEDFPASDHPGSLAYFCNVIADGDLEAHFSPDLGYEASARRLAIAQSRDFVEHDLVRLWPGAKNTDGRFRWDLLHPTVPGSPGTDFNFEGQFVSCNVNPTDRYTLCLPGTPQFRISPLDPSYANFTVCGDWTYNGLNLGCVESAVMSGQLASHAISRSPALSDIIGYDHP